MGYRPVIGIISQEHMGTSDGSYTDRGYVEACYVDWLEKYGAKVFVIPLTTTPNGLLSLLQTQLSGLVIPGAFDEDGTIPNYSILSRASIKLLADGVTSTPIFGICKGLQYIITMACHNYEFMSMSQLNELLTPIPGLMDVMVSKTVVERGRLYKGLPDSTLRKFGKSDSCIHRHHYGIPVEDYEKITDSIRVLTTAVNSTGTEFVTSVEHKILPMWGVQWHPERVHLKAHQKGYLNPSKAAKAVSEYHSKFFVDQCRSSENRFTLSDKLLCSRKNLIVDIDVLASNDDTVRGCYFA